MINFRTLAGSILSILLFTCCNKDEDPQSIYCTVQWSNLKDFRDPVLLPGGTWWNPRVLGKRVWYASSTKVAGVNWDDGLVTVVLKPPGMNILNADQRDVSYVGTDCNSLFYFDWQNSLWKKLYAALPGRNIDNDTELEIMEGLIPFVQKNTSDNAQTIWLYDIAADQGYEVLGLSKLYEERPFEVFTQPKVFVNGADTLLATVVQFESDSTRSVLIFSLKEGKTTTELLLGYGGYQDAFRLGDKFGISYFYSFYHDVFAVIDPIKGQSLWGDGACIWLCRNGDLFSLDCLFGFNTKVNPQTGKTDYFFAPSDDLYSLDGLLSGNYVIPGRVKKDTLSGPLNHIVFVNREKGCEVKRLPLPGQSAVFGKLICLPDSNWVIAQDEKRFVHFLRLQ